MNLVLFTHPEFLGLHSQAHFARMLLEAYRERGHRAELRQPRERLRRLVRWAPLAKWAGYVDQYVIFPVQMLREARSDPADTLYVFCDQALGPWIPWLAHRPHVVHCHDLLALRSAIGEIPENPTSATGRIYQHWIRRGFQQARHMISISERTRDDLVRIGGAKALTSDVVHNGLNHPYSRLAPEEALAVLRRAGVSPPEGEFLLHVGGGQWYKNGDGVVALYHHLSRRRIAQGRSPPALWMVSPPPGAALHAAIANLPAGSKVHFQHGLPASLLQALYSTALALLFPSLAEGFGWPIAEGLACGCPVITTGEPPMTEVGGAFATYLPRLSSPDAIQAWAEAGAEVIERVVDRPAREQEKSAQEGIEWARRFEPQRAIEAYLGIYEQVLARTLIKSDPEAP